MILSRSYSSRNFDERPTSPTMFGAVIAEEVEALCLDDDMERQAADVSPGEGRGEGIQQRLDRLRKHGQGPQGRRGH